MHQSLLATWPWSLVVVMGGVDAESSSKVMLSPGLACTVGVTVGNIGCCLTHLYTARAFFHQLMKILRNVVAQKG